MNLEKTLKEILVHKNETKASSHSYLICRNQKLVIKTAHTAHGVDGTYNMVGNVS